MYFILLLKLIFLTLLSIVTTLYFNDFRLLIILTLFLLIDYIFDFIILLKYKD